MIRKFQNYTEDEMSESGMTFGKNVYIANDVIIHNPQNIIIGDNVRIDTQCVLIAGKNHKIKIGNSVHISAGCYFYGNFWWASAKYINTLDNLSAKMIEVNMERAEAERWLGRKPHRWASLYNENVSDWYMHYFDPKLYKQP